MQINSVNNIINSKIYYQSFSAQQDKAEISKRHEHKDLTKTQRSIAAGLMGSAVAVLGTSLYFDRKNFKLLTQDIESSTKDELKKILSDYYSEDKSSIVIKMLKDNALAKVKNEDIKNIVSKIAKENKFTAKSEMTTGEKIVKFFCDWF